MRSAHPGISASAMHVGGARILAIAAGALITAAPPIAAAAEGVLEEIVVTAERRSERVHDVPIAISALSAADLEARGVRQASDITASVPNMILNSAYGPEAQPTFALRGITTNDFSENQSSPIAMYVDEVYKSVGALQALQVYDLDRVEVLRGPQGTLYGKNATGGAINFYSKSPGLSAYDGYATAGFGNYGAYTLRGAVGGPLIDNELGWRAAVLYEKRDGWVDSIVSGVKPLNGVDALAGRLSLLYKVNDSLAATLKLSVSRSGGTPYGVHALNNVPSFTGFNGTIGWFQTGSKYAVDKNIRNDSASLKLEWQLGEHYTLTSVTGFDYGRWYEKSDDEGLPLLARYDDPNTYFSSVNAVSQEVRIASHDTGAFGWLAGAYYGRESTHATVEFHFADGTQGSYFSPTLWGYDTYNNFDQVKESEAAFVNATFAVTSTITLRAGLRYTKDSVSIRNFYALNGGLQAQSTGYAPDGGITEWTQSIPALPAAPIFSTSLAPQIGTNPTIKQDNSNVSFKAGADWKPSDGMLVYASFSRGYRGAAFNGQAYVSVAELTFAAPETIDSYEVGFKTTFLDRRAEINAAAFHYDYSNQQFLDNFTLPCGCATGFHTVNAPKSRISGAELELRAKASSDFELRASIGVLDTKYVELALHGVNLSGNKMVTAPDFSARAGVDWRFAQLGAGDLHLQLDGNYYGKQYFDPQNTERIAQDAYSVANARLALEGSRGHYTVGAWVKNLGNREYLAYGLNQQSGIGVDYALVGEPRTYGLDLTYRF